MQVVLKHFDQIIPLKKYNSYIDLDDDLLSFLSFDDIMEKMGFDSEYNTILVLDNGNNPMKYDYETIRTTRAFYNDKKGDEFVSWIFYSACNNYHNKNKLTNYFDSQLLKFTNGTDKSSLYDIQNPEGKRLYTLTNEVDKKLYSYGTSTGTLREFRSLILPNMRELMKKNGKYNYYYMRKFACTLKAKFRFNPDIPRVKTFKLDVERQENLIRTFKEVLNKNRMSTIDEMTSEEPFIPVMYDEDGNKVDEIPFTNEGKKLYL